MTSKQIILSHIYDYLKIKKWKYEAKGKIINMICPYCMDKSLTAQAINNTHLIKCHNPECPREGKKYTVISIVKRHEKDKREWDNDKIVSYLKTLLKVKVLTTSDKKELETLFKKYQEYGWALNPNAKNNKKSIEDFNNKIHKDPKEWMEWVELGLNIGVRCGEVSNLTLVDIDTDKIPDEIKDCLGKTLAEKSTKGWHYFYKYDKELPNCRIDELSIEIRNDELQTTITPSTVENVKRNFINNNPIIEVPKELKKVIKKYKKVIKKTETDKDISDEIAQETYQKILMREGDGRNQFFIRFGGILSKFLNREQVRRVLKRLDKVICNPSLGRELDKTVFKSIEKYKFIEDEELTSQILDYLKEVEEAEMRDIERAIMGSYPTSDDKARIDKAVAYLKREDLVQKRGKIFKITKKLNWSTDLTSGALALDFKVPYFDDIMYFNKGDVCIIGAKPGTGKCFAKGTGILMYDGSIKKVEDIVPGDKVMGIDSTPRTVLQIGTGIETMYEVIPNKGEKFKVNASHILSLKSTRYNSYPKGKIVNISIKDYLNKNKIFKDKYKLYRVPIEFNTKKQPIDPYFLGLWLGDGDKTNTRITTKDREIIKYLKGYAKKLNLQLSCYEYTDRCASYAITTGKKGNHQNNFSLQKIMNKMHLLYNDKHIPLIYKTGNRKQRMELLAGLIDSDGYYNVAGKNYEITLTNKILSEDIMYLCRSLGYLSYITEKKATIQKIGYETTAYRIHIIGDCSIIPVKILRKKAEKRLHNKDPLVTSFKLKRGIPEKYYGFTLDKDHLHLIDSFIVNHNTHIAVNCLKKLVEQGVKPYYYSLESGSRFKPIALQLGLKEGDFFYPSEKYKEYDPTKIELEDNAVTIIDWLSPRQYKYTDKIIEHFNHQLDKHGGFLIIFVQLRKSTGDWFAKDLIEQFPAFAVKYFLDDEDGIFGHFEICKMRASQRKTRKIGKLPTRFSWETKEIDRVDRLSDSVKESGDGEDFDIDDGKQEEK